VEEEAEQLYSSSSSSGMTGAEKGKGNGDWKMGEKRAGGGDWNETRGKIRKMTTPSPPPLKGGTLQKPNRRAMALGVGAHHDHGVGAKSRATLRLPK
jgi:hypothetical protein